MPWKLGSLGVHHCRGPLPPYDLDQVWLLQKVSRYQSLVSESVLQWSRFCNGSRMWAVSPPLRCTSEHRGPSGWSENMGPTFGGSPWLLPSSDSVCPVTATVGVGGDLPSIETWLS